MNSVLYKFLSSLCILCFDTCYESNSNIVTLWKVTKKQDRRTHMWINCSDKLLGGLYVKKGERVIQGESCHYTNHCGPLCVPLSLSVCLFFLPCLSTWEHCLEGEKQIWTCGSCHPVLMPLFPFLFYFLWPLHPLLPSISCLLRSLSIIMCTRFCHCNKTVHAYMFAASFALLRWSKSAPYATEKGFNSCVVSYCSLLFMLHTK